MDRWRKLAPMIGMAIAVLALALGAYVLLGGRAALDGSAWQLSEWSVSSLSPSKYTITATFANGQISGTSAVNSYGGPYTTSHGGSFRVGAIAQTEMAGPEDAMRAEHAYHDLLGRARRYTRTPDELALSDENNERLLTFSPAVGQ